MTVLLIGAGRMGSALLKGWRNYLCLARLEQAGWLNDGVFAENRAGSLARQGRLGPSRIRRQLQQHGVRSSDVDAAMASTEVDWRAQCLSVAQARRARGIDLKDPKDRARLVRFLLGRGFSYDLISATLRELGSAPDEP